MELFWKTWIAAISVIVSVGILLVTLVSLEFKRDYENLLGDRMLVIAASAAAPFSAAVELGLPITGVRNAAALLDFPRQTDPLISGVWVLDAQHNVVQGVGQWFADVDGLNATLEAGDGQANGWYTTFGSAFVAGSPIHSAKAERVGQVVVAYPLEVSRSRVLAMAAELSFLVLLIAGVASLAAGLLLRVWMAREIGGFCAVTADLAEFERSVWTMRRGKEETRHADDILGMLEQSRAMYRDLSEKSSEPEDISRSWQQS